MSTTTPHRALYRRWRAQTFGQIVGQEATVQTLRNGIRTGRLSHALLFVGPRGTGKTSTARIVAKALNCADPRDGEPDDTCEACASIRDGRALDVVEMDAASNNRVDDLRELLPRVYTAPSDLTRKVYIVDEVQRIRDGWDVLLKTLEEPPDHVVFIFCTTDASQVRPAVLSRVQRFDFKRLTERQIAGKLVAILDADGRAADPDAIELVAQLADGGMRDAESMLDQLLSGGDERLTADRVRDLLGLAGAESVKRFTAALVDGDALAGIDVLNEIEERGSDLRAFLDQVVDALRSGIVAALGPQATGPNQALADRSPRALAVAARRVVDLDPARLGQGGLRFALELALLDAATGAPDARTGTAASAASVALLSPDLATPHVARVASPASPPGRPRPAPASTPETETAPISESPRRTPRQTATPPTARRAAPAEPADGSTALPSATSETGAAPDGPLTLDGVRDAWPRIAAAVGENPAAKPVISACAPIAAEGSVVTVGFPEAQSFLREIAEKRRSVIEQGFARVLGRPVAVRFVATNVVPEPLAGGPDAARLVSEARRIFAEELGDVPEVR